MNKTYLRYVQQDSFGVIKSDTGDVLYLPSSEGRIALSASLEDVSMWNLKQGVLVDVLRDSDNKHNVTTMALDPQSQFLAVGYENGRIRIWDLRKREIVVSLNAHNNAVSSLCYDITGALLASGSRDTEVVVWDVVSQQGLYRFRGHKDEITDLRFIDVNVKIPIADAEVDNENEISDDNIASIRQSRFLFSSSKDTFVKVWDLDVQQCIHTLTGHRGEVWSFDILHRPRDNYALLVTGSSDKLLRSWKIYTDLTAPVNSTASEISTLFENKGIEFVGVLDRPAGTKRVKKVRFDRVAITNASHTICGSNLPDAYTVGNYNSKTGVYPYANVLVVQGVEKCVDIFAVRTLEDRLKRQKRRQKRFREKGRDKSASSADVDNIPPPTYLPSDDLEAQIPIRTETRVNSFTFNPRSHHKAIGDKSPMASVLVGLVDNSLQTWDMPLQPLIATLNEKEAALASAKITDTLAIKSTVELPGHRSGIRSLALSTDDSLLLSTAGNQIKLWNMNTHNCIRTIDLVENKDLAKQTGDDADDENIADVILSAIFVPGNRHIVLGTKRGYLDLYELASGQLLCREKIHEGMPVWAIDLRPDGRGFVTGGGKEIWAWDFEMIEEEIDQINYNNKSAAMTAQRTVRKLGFSQTRVLKLTDDVLCVKHSPDGRYIAAGLLDNTVRIFHDDTYSFFLSLYGHNLPVITLDISSDSTLIVTGSADKTTKIWGMDFGDCRKSFRAHDNSVMKVQWVPKTHYFFTVGKDKMIKYWDGDKQQDILTLPGHQAEVWSLAIASLGQFIVSGSNDRSIRRWQQTDEPVYVEEEREKRMEEAFDESASKIETGEIGILPGGITSAAQEAVEAWKGVKTSKEALEIGERLIECLDICDSEYENWKRYHELLRIRNKEKETITEMAESGHGIAKIFAENQKTNNEEDGVPEPTPHPYLQGGTPTQYVMRVLRSVKLSELTETLITLPFEYATRLLSHLSRLLEQGVEVELCVKVSLLLMKIHQSQLISTRTMIDTLANLRKYARIRLSNLRDKVGSNMASVKYISNDIESKAHLNFFGEPDEAQTQQRKRQYSTVAAKRQNMSYKKLRRR